MFSFQLNAFMKHQGNSKQGASNENRSKIADLKFELKLFTPTKKKDPPTTTKRAPKEEKDEKPSTPGTPRQKAFVNSVLSYSGKVNYSYGAEGDYYMDCSSFVQYVLEKKGCIDIPYRLTSSSSMGTLFGPAKKCEVGDIVRTGGHMGFYWGPGYYVGNNSGQDGVGVHRSSGTCYPNPCIKRSFGLTI